MVMRSIARRLQVRGRGQTWTRSLTTLGIRREDPKRIWERRVPLTPKAVQGLINGSEQVRVEIESCKRRCFPDDLFSKVGAQVVDSLSKDVDVVLGIKEPPIAEVEALINSSDKKRTWMIFSHTHKGQRYNTGLLSALMDEKKGQTLIDHELLTAPTGKGDFKRVAAFGWFAGAVGAGECLSMTGLALLKRGVATPLLNLPRPYTFTDLAEYKAALKFVGDKIRAGSTTPDQPIVIGLTGAGNVSTGAQEMLEELGAEWVKPEDLESLKPSNQIYACAIPPSAYFVREDGKAYSREDYYASPASYSSVFSIKIAPYLTALINGAGWKTGFPRIISNADMDKLVSDAGGKPKLAAIQDVTCDLDGNLEMIDRLSTIDTPYFERAAGILISTVDILPTELAKDASEHFSKCLLPYVKHFTQSPSSDRSIKETLDRAMILRDGKLTSEHEWLQPRVDELRASTQASSGSVTALRPQRKRVLLLGSGLVAGPAVSVFSNRSDVQLVIASNNLQEANSHVRDRSNVETLALDVGDDSALGAAVSQADVIVSLLPAPMHVQVAEHCIKHKKHLVTASYISPEMKALHGRAQQSDIVLLGECGLDPGIDSMAAMRILDRVNREGRKVTSFVSWCGGLPEPSASNVPLGYKFSWSPRAVLTAAQNDAHFKLNGQIHEIAGQDLLREHFPKVNLWKGLALEGLANRDSIPYAEKYGLGSVDSLKDLFRGTLRYQGFSKLLDAFRVLGLINTSQLASAPASWQDLVSKSISGISGESVGEKDVIPFLRSSGLSSEVVEETQEAMKWLGLSSGSTAPALPSLGTPTPIDYFAYLLSHKLAYEPHERDSALLHHSFKLASREGEKQGEVSASLLCYGTEEGSAMSITVGKTLAFAALRVLDGHVKIRGVRGPYEREVWEGVLDSLEEVGVRVEEKWA